MRLVCIVCGVERPTEKLNESIANYQKRRPRCYACRSKGMKNSGQFKAGTKPWNTGKRYFQIEWDKHPLFKYGATRYRQLLKRSGVSFKCDQCNVAENIDVHHRDGNRNNNDLSNLVPLCKKCHQHTHRNWEKSWQHVA